MAENLILARLPSGVRSSLFKRCETVEFRSEDVLYRADSPLRNVLFPQSGIVSLFSRMDGSPVIEVRSVGREGMLGAQLVVGATREPCDAVAQVAGLAWRIDAASFRQQLLKSLELRAAIGRYVTLAHTQLALATVCVRFHRVGPRLARWMLTNQDRLKSDRFRITHESLALMLGVRRVGITTAAAAFQRQGVLEYHRGHVTILDRAALGKLSCSCYVTDRRTYTTYVRSDR